MLKDKGLLVLFTIVSMIFGFAMLLNGIAYWWLFWFSVLFFYGHLVDKLLKEERHKNWSNDSFSDESKYWPPNWEDYKSQYVPPEEYNLPKELAKPVKHRHPIITAIVKDKNNYCKECGYLVCVCKPIVN